MIKLNANASLIWAKQYEFFNSDFSTSEFNEIKLTNDNNILCIGSSYNGDFSNHESAIILKKVDNNGIDMWQNYYFNSFSNNEGLLLDENVNGDIVISGNFEGTIDFDFSSSAYEITSNGVEMFILKLNALGKYNGSCDFDLSGNGATYSSPNDDGFFLTINENGNYSNVKVFQHPSNILIKSIKVSEENEVVLLGNFSQTYNFNPPSIDFERASNSVSDAFLLIYSSCEINTNWNEEIRYIYEGESVSLTSPITKPQYTYQWFKNGQQIINEQNQSISFPDLYFLVRYV